MEGNEKQNSYTDDSLVMSWRVNHLCKDLLSVSKDSLGV